MIHEDCLSMLIRLEPFKRLTSDVLKKICKASDLRRYDSQEVVYFPDTDCETLDVIVDGEVAVKHVSKHGHVLIIESFTAPALVGLNCLFSEQSMRTMLVQAQSSTKILKVSKNTLLELLKEHEAFMISTMRELSKRTHILATKLSKLTLLSLRERIVLYLKEASSAQGSWNVALSSSKAELAETLGTRRSSLSRELIKMREEGLLTFDRHSIQIKDSALFEEIDG